MAMENIYEMLDTYADIDTTDLRAAIEGEFGLISEGAQAKITELEAANAELVRELQEVKSKNFDLMVAATAKPEPEDEEEPEPEALPVEDLFKEE